MRTLITYVISALILMIAVINAPYLKVYPLYYYNDTASLAFLIFGGLGAAFLWTRQDFKTLAQLLMGRELSFKAAQGLLLNLEKSWRILAYGGLFLGLLGLVSVLYDVSDMARLGNSLALSILFPLYLLLLRWWVVAPLIQSLKKVTLADPFEL